MKNDYASIVAQSLDDPEFETRRLLKKRMADSAQKTTAGALAYGASLGYLGNEPEGLGQWLAAIAGGAIPATAATLLTGPAAPVVAGALRLGPTALAARAAVHGGLAGLLTGAVGSAESFDDRLQHMLLEGTLGAAIPGGMFKWKQMRNAAKSGATGYNVQGGANLPELVADPDYKTLFYESAPKWSGQGPTPIGAFSRIPASEQLTVPGMAKKPPKVISVQDAAPEVAPFTEVPVPEQIKPTEFFSEWTQPEVIRKAEPTSTPKAPVTKTESKAPYQMDLPFAGRAAETQDALTRLGKSKGFDVSRDAGGFTLRGPGGRVERFDTPDQAYTFLSAEKDAPPIPVIDYGTFEKAVNAPWTSGAPFLDAGDKAALQMQRVITYTPHVTIGHGLAGGIQKLGGRARVNVFTGLTSETELAAAQKMVVDAGYKPGAPLRIGEAWDLPYAAKWDRQTKSAVTTYAQLRVEGPRGPLPDAVTNMGVMFGLNADEVVKYASQNALHAAQDGMAHNLYLGQLGYPQMSSSPVISHVTRKVQIAASELRLREDWVYKNIRDRYIRPLADADQALATDVIEGKVDFSKAPEAVQNAVMAYRDLMADMARLLNIPEWNNYVTHVTDMDAVWDAVRESVLKDGVWQKKPGMTKEAFAKLRDLASTNKGTWNTLSPEAQSFVKREAMNWDVSDWGKLPASVRRKLPEEIFSRYLIPRANGVDVPYERNLSKIFDKYVPGMLRKIAFDPVLEETRPIINALPESSGPLSERRYLESYLDRVVFNRPGETSRALRDAVGDVERTFGVSMSDSSVLNDMITLYRGSQYRGLIGIDSALKNFNQVVNVAAENGIYLGYALKRLPDIVARRGYKNLPGVTQLRGTDVTELLYLSKRTGAMDKALRINAVANNIALYPMQLTENVVRGFSWHVGLEEAAQMGLDTKSALRYAAGKASQIMPNMELTEAQYHAMLNVMKTNFGFDLSQAPPVFAHPLVRLSTLFMTYPIREMEFLSRGIGKSLNGFFTMAQAGGYNEALRTAEFGKTMRYLASTGFLFGASYFAAKMGVDMTNFFTQVNVAMPFWQTAANAYSALTGQEPFSRERAAMAVKDSIMATVVPQYRMLKKGVAAEQAVRDGYSVDTLGRFIHTSTPFGEFMNFLGIPPTQYTRAKNLAREWAELGQSYTYERHAAIEALVREGDQKAPAEFAAKWGRQITPKDIQKYMEEAMESPQYRASRKLPQEAVRKLAGERPYLFNREGI